MQIFIEHPNFIPYYFSVGCYGSCIRIVMSIFCELDTVFDPILYDIKDKSEEQSVTLFFTFGKNIVILNVVQDTICMSTFVYLGEIFLVVLFCNSNFLEIAFC